MKRTLNFLACSCLVASLSGCEIETNTDADGGGGSPPAPPPITLTVTFVDALSKEPLVGLSVCAAEHDDLPCATTDAAGAAKVALPASSEIMLACTLSTHVPTYMTLKTPAEDYDVGVFRLLSTSIGSAFVKAAGATQDPTKGIVLANVYEDIVNRDVRVADATFTIAPTEGLGPVYGGTLGLPDPTLPASTTMGPAAFLELTPGEHTVTIAHPTRTCTGGFGWPTENPLALRTKVFAGGMSTVTFVCPP